MRKLIELIFTVLAACAVIVGLHHLWHTRGEVQGAVVESRKGD